MALVWFEDFAHSLTCSFFISSTGMKLVDMHADTNPMWRFSLNNPNWFYSFPWYKIVCVCAWVCVSVCTWMRIEFGAVHNKHSVQATTVEEEEKKNRRIIHQANFYSVLSCAVHLQSLWPRAKKRELIKPLLGLSDICGSRDWYVLRISRRLQFVFEFSGLSSDSARKRVRENESLCHK